jgi:hypothetical protein
MFATIIMECQNKKANVCCEHCIVSKECKLRFSLEDDRPNHLRAGIIDNQLILCNA